MSKHIGAYSELHGPKGRQLTDYIAANIPALWDSVPETLQNVANTGTAYTATLLDWGETASINYYPPLKLLWFRPHVPNNAFAVLTISGLPALPLVYPDGGQLSAGTLLPGVDHLLRVSSDSTRFEVLSFSQSPYYAINGGYAHYDDITRWSKLPHVEDWRGHAGDSSDTGTLQAAIDAATGLPLRLPALLTITSQINISRGGTSLIGAGWGADVPYSSGPTTPACSIVWGGEVPTAGTAMLHVMSATPDNYIWDFFIDRVYLGGNNAAPVGLRLSSTRTAHIGRLMVERCTENAVLLDDANGALHYATKIDELYAGPGSNPACANMNGLNIRQDPIVGPHGCTWIHGDFLGLSTVNGNALVFGNVDNCHFSKVAAGVSGTGYGIRFRGLSDGQFQVSRKNFISQFSGHNIYVETKSRNVIDWINSEGPHVIIEPGGVLHYKVLDREDGRRWSTFSYPTDLNIPLPTSNGYVVTGTPALATVGTTKFQSVYFDPAITETWGWTLGPQRANSGGRIVGFKGTGCKSVSTNTGNIRLQVGVKGTGTTQGLGAGLNSTLITHTVDAAAALTFEEFTITLATPADYQFESNLLVHFSRLGADAADTFPDDWCLLSLAVITQADVADGDPPPYHYDVPDDRGDTT